MDSNSLIPNWNKLLVRAPDVVSLEVISDKSGTISLTLKRTLDNILEVLKQHSPLNAEAALLSRMIYRMKSKFSKDKGFKAMKKVNKSLLNYLCLDMESTILSLQLSVYDRNGPSKEMLEWALMRILAYGKLFLRIRTTCIESARYFFARLRDGHSWEIALICISILSRIWVLSSYITQKTCVWYDNLKHYLPLLTSSKNENFTKNFIFPEDMESWLGHPSFLKQREEVKRYDFPESFMKDGSFEQSLQNVEVLKANYVGATFNEDLGEPVTEGHSVLTKDPIDQITSIRKLLQFIANEKISRKQKLSSSKTKQMSNLKWKEFEEYIYSNISKLRKIQQGGKLKIELKQLRTTIKQILNKR